MSGYELKITLMDYNKAFKNAKGKGVWFKLQVPDTFSFDQLHRAIMVCTNWAGYHMYAFQFKKLKATVQYEDESATPLGGAESFMQIIKQQLSSGKIDISKLENGGSISSFDLDMSLFESDKSGYFDPKKTKLCDLFEREKSCIYQYDFGDSWECKIDAKTIDSFDGMSKVLSFEGKWPPEDCGGTGGFEEILELLAKAETGDKKAQKHEMMQWLKGMKFDDFDINRINTELQIFLQRKQEKSSK